MFVFKNTPKCTVTTKLDYASGGGPLEAQCIQSRAYNLWSQRCLVSFWRQTNIKKWWAIGTQYNLVDSFQILACNYLWSCGMQDAPGAIWISCLLFGYLWNSHETPRGTSCEYTNWEMLTIAMHRIPKTSISILASWFLGYKLGYWHQNCQRRTPRLPILNFKSKATSSARARVS